MRGSISTPRPLPRAAATSRTEVGFPVPRLSAWPFASALPRASVQPRVMAGAAVQAGAAQEAAAEGGGPAGVRVGERRPRAVDVEEAEGDRRDAVGGADGERQLL